MDKMRILIGIFWNLSVLALILRMWGNFFYTIFKAVKRKIQPSEVNKT